MEKVKKKVNTDLKIHLFRYRPLKLDKRSKVAKNIKSKFFEDEDLVKTNHLINLESHSMPVFLFKQVIPIMKKELLFKKRISQLANKFFQKITRAERLRKLIFVGLHARRGDRLLNWINGKETLVLNPHHQCFGVISDTIWSMDNVEWKLMLSLSTGNQWLEDTRGDSLMKPWIGWGGITIVLTLRSCSLQPRTILCGFTNIWGAKTTFTSLTRSLDRPRGLSPASRKSPWCTPTPSSPLKVKIKFQ